MLSAPWVFIGALSGLLVVSVFSPPPRTDMQLPLPGEANHFRTKTGCVKFRTTEVPCTNNATSLNFIASQDK
jgi:hypothetical protein